MSNIIRDLDGNGWEIDKTYDFSHDYINWEPGTLDSVSAYNAGRDLTFFTKSKPLFGYRYIREAQNLGKKLPPELKDGKWYKFSYRGVDHCGIYYAALKEMLVSDSFHPDIDSCTDIVRMVEEKGSEDPQKVD